MRSFYVKSEVPKLKYISGGVRALVSQLRLFLQVSETMSVTGEVSVGLGQAGPGLGDTFPRSPSVISYLRRDFIYFIIVF